MGAFYFKIPRPLKELKEEALPSLGQQRRVLI